MDPSGAVVPNATIKAVDLATNRESTATAGKNGEFVIPGLTEGFYKVTISARGFSDYVVGAMQVNVSQTAHINAKLTVGAVGTEVSVVADQASVQTETAEVKFAIDQKQIMNMSLPTRNPLDIVRLLPGMSTPTGGVTGGDVIVHGLRANSTNITLDGINIADNYVKTSSFFGINAPVVDSVGEFNVSTSGIGVDAGFGAAQVSMRTARGTNGLHGAVYWFQRNSFLNANTYFNKQQTPVTKRPFQLQNRLGFNVGGPVFAPKIYNGKNKLFFFGSFEAYRQPASQSQVRTVWTPAARNGMFTYTGTDKAQHTVNILDPTLGGKIGGTGLPVVSNAALLGVYNSVAPAPTGFSGCSGADNFNIGCYLWNASGVSKQQRYAGRIDYNINNNHSVEATYNQQNFLSAPDFLNSGVASFPGPGGSAQESKRQLFSWAVHSTFGTNKTNEARFGLTRAPVSFSLKQDYSPSGNVQIVVPTVSNPYFVQGNFPQGRNTPVRQFTDNFAWVKGHHTLKLGGEWRWISALSFLYSYTQYPRLDIASSPQGTGLTDPTKFPGGISSTDLTKAGNLFAFVTGMLGSTRQGYVRTSPTSGYVTNEGLLRQPSQNNYAFYAQDSWKMFSNFTLEYGMRWEYQGRYQERNGLALQPVDPVAGPWGAGGVGNFFNVLSTPAATDIQLHYVSGDNQPLYNAQWKNFAPFVGFAWDPFKDGKTSIRSGFALHYTQDGFTVFNNAVSYADGLRITPLNSSPTGVYNPSSIPFPAAPADSYSQKTNLAANNAGIIVGVKPNIAVPYVLEWNFGIQREVFNKLTVEARYVGNHAVKQYRMWDVNQVNLDNNPYTFGGNSVANARAEFNNAQKNYITCGSSSLTCAGALPLPILSALNVGVSAANNIMTNSTLRGYVRDGQIGNFYDFLRRQAPYRTNMFANFPLNFFVPDPWALNSLVMDNSSWSQYHAMELEVRRRFSSGLTFQGNYTWSHGITDQRFGTAQDEFQAFRDVRNLGLERYRSPFDQRHALSAQVIFPLPFGRGKMFGSGVPAWADKVIGGWQIQGGTRLANGSPFTISSGRVTTGFANITSETAVIKNMTPHELGKLVGTYKTANGVFWLNPNSGLFTLTSTGSKPTLCTATTTTPCFDYPGTYVSGGAQVVGSADGMGNTSFAQFTGPAFWNQDFSITKNLPISSVSERFGLEFRVEMYNVFNHPQFSNPTASIGDSSKFGQLTSLTDTSRGGGVNSRNMAFQLRVVF
jgi:hypothetical protein